MSDTASASPPLDALRFRRLASARLLAAPLAGHADGPTEGGSVDRRPLPHPSDFDLNPGMDGAGSATLIPAAVLVGVCARETLTLLLTERTPHLSAHAGQIAFPGGRIDAGDADALAAALREAREEIGLDPARVEPLGYLDPYRTSTGYLITPVVALIDPGFTLAANPNEVADHFEVPLDFLMDQANHRIDSRHWRGAERRFYAMPYEQRYIWGATAGIIRALHRRLFTA